MPYLHFIRAELDSKDGQIEVLDVTFQMQIIAKIFDIIKYLKNKKIKNLKKRKNRENYFKRPKKAIRFKFFFRRSILNTKRKK